MINFYNREGMLSRVYRTLSCTVRPYLLKDMRRCQAMPRSLAAETQFLKLEEKKWQEQQGNKDS